MAPSMSSASKLASSSPKGGIDIHHDEQHKLKLPLPQLVLREASAVFVWSILSCVLRMAISLLTALSSVRHQGDGATEEAVDVSDVGGAAATSIAACGAIGGNALLDDGSCISETWALKMWDEAITVASVLAGWFLSILPSKAAKVSYAGNGYGAAPGFSFASTWILYPIRDRFGSLPNIPARICETQMGRLTLRELAVVLPIHFIVPTLGMHALRLLLLPFDAVLSSSVSLSRHAIDPISYSEDNPWIVDFAREVVVNAAFTVTLLAIPELLRINGIRRGFALLLMYPLFAFGVDAEGTASVFGPDTMYALRSVNSENGGLFGEVSMMTTQQQWSHMVGPIVGGVLGGYVMNHVFPDES